MSTRATYLFKGDDIRPDVCFYIHYDGYPEGAAEYFRDMLNQVNERGGLAGRFIRGNSYAEFTGGHNNHGDTEYRYTIHQDGKLEAWHRPINQDFKSLGTWDHVAEFVNQYDQNGPKFVRLEHTYGRAIWFEEPKAVQHLELTTLKAILALKNQGPSGNAAYAIAEAAGLCRQMGREALAEGLPNLLEGAKEKQAQLQALSIEELEGMCSLNDLPVPQRPSFGDARSNAVTLLVGDWVRQSVGLNTYRVRIKRGYPSVYEIPEGIDPLVWLNWGYESSGRKGYEREDIEILGVTAPPDKRIAA